MYRFSKIARTRLQQINKQSKQNISPIFTNKTTAYLSTSSHQNNFFQKLKENIDQESAKDDKLKAAQEKAQQEIKNIGKEFDPLMEKSKKIQADSMSETAKKMKELKEGYQKGKEKLQEKAQQSAFLKDKVPKGLKFKMNVPKGVDQRQWEEIKNASAAAELLKS